VVVEREVAIRGTSAGGWAWLRRWVGGERGSRGRKEGGRAGARRSQGRRDETAAREVLTAEALRRMVWEEGRGLEEVGAEVEATQQMVLRLLRERVHVEWAGGGRGTLTAELREWVRDYDDGRHAALVAAMWGCHPETVRRARDRVEGERERVGMAQCSRCGFWWPPEDVEGGLCWLCREQDAGRVILYRD